MIRSHIGSTKDCKMIFKLERLSYLLSRSFGLGCKTPTLLNVIIIVIELI